MCLAMAINVTNFYQKKHDFPQYDGWKIDFAIVRYCGEYYSWQSFEGHFKFIV